MQKFIWMFQVIIENIRTSAGVPSVWSILHSIKMQTAHSVKASGEKKQKRLGLPDLGEHKHNPAFLDQDQAG